ncbi:MAG TPA: PilZ domain-containing protein [Vicinamibacterales bacterium]|nr:PilZ domain-containing protein [Vicinamibacterales bacterium]
MTERRRTPRIELRAEGFIRIELRHRVELLDISQTGALVACEAALHEGTRGQIRIGLDEQPFIAEVAVKRHHLKSARPGHVGLGTMFGTMEHRCRQDLEKFLQRVKE